MKRKQMMISFGAYDDDVYEFMQNNKNASALVRMLVRAYMRGENVSPSVPANTTKVEKPVATEPKVVEEKVVETKPKMQFDYSKCGTEEVVATRNEDNNRKKIQQLDL